MIFTKLFADSTVFMSIIYNNLHVGRLCFFMLSKYFVFPHILALNVTHIFYFLKMSFIFIV